ncbi:epoxyqueuosine reductase QueH [Treponema sp. OMZ 799]|uniref:epoxyqueuosine reductase QueH n=1 Tax=Treponema sp. OMZ 799 TaxID=2563668 RepID=UPI0020A3FDB0|nr:epoxyqueuosine reductase QueH [Treponema sp. OMZ 799]UTC78483.1 epoxyqueuosine reductase QueH [Treponema sp. OMZ 799]
MTAQKINYDRLMQDTIKNLGSNDKTLLLHSCCAPCSSSVILKLAPFFKLTIFYYNSNIDTSEEYEKRAQEQRHLISIYNEEKLSSHRIEIIKEAYDPQEFREISQGLEDCPEGGERCMRCYLLRLKKTAERAKKEGFDFFSTTLSVSPLKNAEKLNSIGLSLETENCKWLPCDFKKRNGYLDSINLSKKYGLYRQDYCGCVYSKR